MTIIFVDFVVIAPASVGPAKQLLPEGVTPSMHRTFKTVSYEQSYLQTLSLFVLLYKTISWHSVPSLSKRWTTLEQIESFSIRCKAPHQLLGESASSMTRAKDKKWACLAQIAPEGYLLLLQMWPPSISSNANSVFVFMSPAWSQQLCTSAAEKFDVLRKDRVYARCYDSLKANKLEDWSCTDTV